MLSPDDVSRASLQFCNLKGKTHNVQYSVAVWLHQKSLNLNEKKIMHRLTVVGHSTSLYKPSKT